MVEKNFQTMFSSWVAENKTDLLVSHVWELKLCKGTSLPFNALAPHQIEKLLEAETAGVYHKISDMPFIPGHQKMRFTSKKPFDCTLIRGLGYVVVLFYKPRQHKKMIWIRINDWLHEEKTCGRKSITEKRALEIGKTFHIK